VSVIYTYWVVQLNYNEYEKIFGSKIQVKKSIYNLHDFFDDKVPSTKICAIGLLTPFQEWAHR
jgi:hypothetical protein